MTQFLYFFPGPAHSVVPRERVRSTFAVTALRDLLRSDKAWNGAFVPNPCLHDGPGGQQGTILSPRPVEGGFPDGFTPAYCPTQQEWIQIGDAWLGWFRDLMPTEASLRKPSMIPGYPVTLNDECQWTAPTIRCQPVGSRVTLPQAIRLGKDGQRQVGLQEFYQHWQDLTEKLWDFRWGKAEMRMTDLIDGAAELLSLNYRVGPREVDALGLFDLVADDSADESNWSDIIAASCDWPLVQEQIDKIKKKAQPPEDSEVSAGSEAEMQPAEV